MNKIRNKKLDVISYLHDKSCLFYSKEQEAIKSGDIEAINKFNAIQRGLQYAINALQDTVKV